MVGYLDLPNELRNQIELSQDDLSRLSRTSKAMRHAVLPRLFRNVSMYWHAYKPAPPLSVFLAQIFRSHETAGAVDELHFHANGYGRNDPSEECKSKMYRRPNGETFLHSDRPLPPIQYKPAADEIDSETKDLLLEALRSMHMSSDEETLNKHDLIDVVIMVIMARCPNLKVLSMDLEFLHQNEFLPKLVSHLLNIGSESPTTHAAFTKLAKIQLGREDMHSRCKTWIEFPVSSYLPFFYLPSLEAFSAPLSDAADIKWHHLGKHTPKTWLTSLPPISTVSKLHLHQSFVDAETVEFLIAQMPHLECLKLDLYHSATMLLDCAPLRSALAHAGTLKELDISYKVFSFGVQEEDEMDQYLVGDRGIGTLDFLTHLTKLEISLPILMGWNDPAGLRLADALPSSLEEFCLRDDAIAYMDNMWWEEIAIEEVRHWMDEMSLGESTPHMKRFGLRMDNSESAEWSKQHVQTLMDICKAKGLQFWSERQPSRWEWMECDLLEIVTDKIRGDMRYEYPKSELGKRVRRMLHQRYPDVETSDDSDSEDDSGEDS